MSWQELIEISQEELNEHIAEMETILGTAIPDASADDFIRAMCVARALRALKR